MDPKTAAQAAFDRVEANLVALSYRIHAHPELKWEEEPACAWLGEALTGYGFVVESGICDYPEWDLLVQMMDDHDHPELDWDPLDDTKVWPEEVFEPKKSLGSNGQRDTGLTWGEGS
jgi:hypothetical protein